jgi:hypothetical protein
MRDLTSGVTPGQLREWSYDPKASIIFLVVSVEGRTVEVLSSGSTFKLSVGDVIIASTLISDPEHCVLTA